MRGAIVAMCVAAIVLLPGCTDAPPDDEGGSPPVEGPDDAGPVVIMTALDAEACVHVEALVRIADGHARTMLPPGVEPVPHPLDADAAALVLALVRCSGEGMPASPAARFEAAILIAPPPLPENVTTYDVGNGSAPEPAGVAQVHRYLVAGHADHAAWLGVYRQAGVDGGEASVVLDLGPVGDGASVTASARDDAGALVETRGATRPETGAVTLVQSWRMSDHGLLLVRALLVTADGGVPTQRGGAGSCTVRGDSPAGAAVGGVLCGDALVSVTTTDASATALWFHGERFLGQS